MNTILVGILFFVVIILSLGFLRTEQIQKSSNESLFLKGQLPRPALNGFYKGQAQIMGPWKGKSFDSSSSSGINIINTFNNTSPIFPFKTYSGKALLDPNLEVLKIDYNISSNPFWVRLVVDELVQIAPNQYLGKAILRLVPNLPFGLMYFRLEK
ncbi:hypothetical protein HY025_02020 [Candidatus Daviesbacteria bacterium]|nr:hypothetical protein [Candidatus Daviesbacteria bacterium]